MNEASDSQTNPNDLGIRCPVCPMCGAFPTFAWVELVPWFCPNDDCNVLAWDPYSTAQENLQDAHEWTDTGNE